MDPSYEEGIRNSVREAVERFAREFTARHLDEIDNPEGTINSMAFPPRTGHIVYAAWS